MTLLLNLKFFLAFLPRPISRDPGFLLSSRESLGTLPVRFLGFEESSRGIFIFYYPCWGWGDYSKNSVGSWLFPVPRMLRLLPAVS